MKLQKIILSLFTLTVFGCNFNNTQNKEKELLERETELLRREEVLNKNNTSQDQKQQNVTDNKEVKSIDKNYLILNNSVGIYKIGDKIPFPETSDNYKIKKEIQTRMTEEGSEEEPIYIVNENSNDLLNIKPEYDLETGNYNKSIGEIIVLSSKFKTLDGIGVNSTIEDFVNTYPNYRIWYTYVSGMYVIDSKDINAQFILNGKDFSGKLKISSDMSILKKSEFKTNSRILKIRVI